MKHVWYKCPSPCERYHNGHCVYCDGGLSFCTVCKGGEAELTKDCPGEVTTEDQRERVMAGEIDFVGGAWHALKGERVTRRRIILDD